MNILNTISKTKYLSNGDVVNFHNIIEYQVDFSNFNVTLSVGAWKELVDVGAMEPVHVYYYTLTQFTDWNPDHVNDFNSLLISLPEWEADVVCYTSEELIRKENKPEGTYVWDSKTRQWVDERTLEETKTQKWEAIKETRSKEEYKPFTYDGCLFDANVTKITAASQLAFMAKVTGQPFAMNWTLFDNSVKELDADAMMAVGLALGQHVDSVYNIARQLRDAINAAQTKEEVELVAWPA